MRWNYLTGIVLCSLSLITIGLTSLPTPTQTVTIPFSTEDNEAGTLTLTTPMYLKVGDRSMISLKLEFSQEMLAGSEQKKLDMISQLEIGNLDVTPKGEGHVTIDPDEALTFRWLVNPHDKENYSGILWLFKLRSEEERLLILGRSMEFSSKEFFGFSYRTSRIVAFVGLVIGLGLLFPIFLHFKKGKKVVN
jgi:hypothetical protein